MASEHEMTARLLSRLAAAGFRVQSHDDGALRTAAQRCLDAITRGTVLAGLFARIALAEEIERVFGVVDDRILHQRIDDVVDAWLADRHEASSFRSEPTATAKPQRAHPNAEHSSCDAHAFGQIERAAHVLQMLTAGGVHLARPAELGRLLSVLASSLARRGPHARPSDYDTAAATLSALEAAHLITIDTARRKRATAILGSALAVRC